MDTSKWKYLLVVQGEKFKNDASQQAPFLQRGYYDRLDDALVALLKMDLSCFEPSIAAGQPENVAWYHSATIVDSVKREPLVEVLHRPIGHLETDQLPPGLYLQFNGDLMDFEYLFDGSLYDLVTADGALTCLKLAKYRYHDRLELIASPMLGKWKGHQGNLCFNVTAELPGWNYSLHVKTTSWRELPGKYPPAGREDGPWQCLDTYQFKDLRDAFWSLVNLDFYKMDKAMMHQRGLADQLHHAFVINNHDVPVIEIGHIAPSTVSGHLQENGVFLIFNMEVTRVQELTGLDLSMLKPAGEKYIWHQLLAYSADATDYVATDQFGALLSAQNLTPYPAYANRYVSAAPYYLLVERAAIGEKGTLAQLSSTSDIRHFSSMQGAFEALLHLDPDQFFAQRSERLGRSHYIKGAQVIDATDNVAVWSKFALQSDHPHLPSDVYIQLHERKITFESIQLTLYHFSAIAGQSGLYFMAGKAGRVGSRLQQHKGPAAHPGDHFI